MEPPLLAAESYANLIAPERPDRRVRGRLAIVRGVPQTAAAAAGAGRSGRNAVATADIEAREG